MNAPKERIYKLMKEIYSEFTGQEVAEAIAQIRKEIEHEATQAALKSKIEELQQKLDAM